MDSKSIYFQLLPLVLLIALMYFMLIRPQKKKEKEVNAMRSNIKVGDSIVTIGGLCGKVVKVKDETIVIQVGADKVKFEMMKWSVSQVVEKKEKTLEEKVSKPKKLKKATAKDEPAKDEILDVEIEAVEDDKATEPAEAKAVETEVTEPEQAAVETAEEVAEATEAKDDEN